MNFDEFLSRCRKVTDNYVQAWGGHLWIPNDQFRKIAEEYGELANATTNLNELEEGWDIIFAVITYFHTKKFDDNDITKSMLMTLKKIEERSIKVRDFKND